METGGDDTRLASAQQEIARLRARVAALEARPQLASPNEWYREFTEMLPQIVFEVDLEGRFVYFSPFALRTTGYGYEEAVRLTVYDLLRDEQKEEARDFFARRLTDDTAEPGEYWIRCKDGSYLPIIAYLNVVYEEGRPAGFRGIAVDVSEQKRMELALRESEARYRETVDTLTDGVHVVDRDLRVVLCNQVFHEWSATLGIPDLRPGQQLFEVFSFLPARVRDEYAHVLAHAEKVVTRESNELAGRTVLTETVKSPILVGGEVHGVLTVVRDITAQVGMEQRLRDIQAQLEDKVRQRTQEVRDTTRRLADEIEVRTRTEEEYARLFIAIEQSAQVVVITDTRGVIQYVNPAFEATTQYARAEAIGLRPSILKSGRQDEAFYKDLWTTISRGRTWRGHFVNRRKDGTLYEEESSISPVFDANGQVTSYVGMKYDVTERKDLERQLFHAQKLESLGTLASGMAHDFKNYLAIIAGYTGMAQKMLPDGSPRDCVAKVAKAAERATAVVNKVLSYSRSDEQESIPVRVASAIEEALDFIRPATAVSIETRFHAMHRDRWVLADSEKIHQALVNIITNAHQAMAERGGLLEVVLDDARHAPRVFLPEGRETVSGKFVRITVSDTGHGMDEHVLERVFDPFFTTRVRGEGTGLGLSIAQRIVHGCGGVIEIESRVNAGTTVTLFLPRCDQLPPRQEKEALGDLRGEGCIMVVDDEEAIVCVTQSALEEYGYQVRVFTDASSALETFRAAPRDFDLVIADYRMPVMSGLELVRQCLETRADLPALIVSGTERRRVPEAEHSGIAAWLNKPVPPVRLAQAVKRALQAQPRLE